MFEELNSGFEKLIKGKAAYKSDNLGLNLLISRLQKKYEVNQTVEGMNNCMMEMKAFLGKYTTLFEKDIQALKNI